MRSSISAVCALIAGYEVCYYRCGNIVACSAYHEELITYNEEDKYASADPEAKRAKERKKGAATNKLIANTVL
jgi:hypothetical protein